jgi:hypothetical protein
VHPFGVTVAELSLVTRECGVHALGDR